MDIASTDRNQAMDEDIETAEEDIEVTKDEEEDIVVIRDREAEDIVVTIEAATMARDEGGISEEEEATEELKERSMEK